MATRLPNPLFLRIHCSQRLFSTIASQRQQVAPESPRFIEIPRPPRTPPLWKPIVKGKLPRPKNIFPSVGPDKTSAEYLALATKEPVKRKAAPKNKPVDAAFIEWKAKMAKKRRQNLREGIIELAEKKRQFEDKRARVLSRRVAERQALLDRKEREDVRLTLPSVLSTLKTPENFSDPNRKERLAQKREQLQVRLAEKVEMRRDQLHNLYLNASTFLLTEKQLDQAIEEEFTDTVHPKAFPLTVSEMLVQRARAPSGANLGGPTPQERDVILEAGAVLTGGKLAKDRFLKRAE